mmetsp:Transcript_103154/g.178145  ORF Transcript_103154/g.178145 Transcript_103154/m.178145 type:complete len:239 (+) Transcript_103154:87-803(+)
MAPQAQRLVAAEHLPRALGTVPQTRWRIFWAAALIAIIEARPSDAATSLIGTHRLRAPAAAAASPSPAPQSAANAERNGTLALVSEYDALQSDVQEAWNSWQEAVAVLGPKVERLSLEATRMKEALSSARRLRVPKLKEVCARAGSCGLCAEIPICGWCATSMKCVPGNLGGPLAQCPQYHFNTCSGMSCEVYESCETCTTDLSCAWSTLSLKCTDGKTWSHAREGDSLVEQSACNGP